MVISRRQAELDLIVERAGRHGNFSAGSGFARIHQVGWLALLSLVLVSAEVAAQQLEDFPTNPAGAAVFHPRDPGNLSLIVAQTDEVHDQIETLLEQLRRLQGVSTVVEVPFTQASDDFFEQIGVNFGFSLPGGANVVGLDPAGNPTPDGRLNFNQGGFNSATPPFGGDPGSSATFGFRLGQGGGPTLDFNFVAGQGSNRTLTTTAPVVHVMDGQTASVADVSQMPFVTSVIPVVGGFTGELKLPFASGGGPSPLQLAIGQYREQRRRSRGRAQREAEESRAQLARQPDLPREAKLPLQLAASRASSAGRGDLSLAEIRRRRAVEQTEQQLRGQQELLIYLERARGAADRGKFGAARVYFQQAAKRATGDLKQRILAELSAIAK